MDIAGCTFTPKSSTRSSSLSQWNDTASFCPSSSCLTCTHHSAPDLAASHVPSMPATWSSNTLRASSSSAHRGSDPAASQKDSPTKHFLQSSVMTSRASGDDRPAYLSNDSGYDRNEKSRPQSETPPTLPSTSMATLSRFRASPRSSSAAAAANCCFSSSP